MIIIWYIYYVSPDYKIYTYTLSNERTHRFYVSPTSLLSKSVPLSRDVVWGNSELARSLAEQTIYTFYIIINATGKYMFIIIYYIKQALKGQTHNMFVKSVLLKKIRQLQSYSKL